MKTIRARRRSLSAMAVVGTIALVAVTTGCGGDDSSSPSTEVATVTIRDSGDAPPPPAVAPPSSPCAPESVARDPEAPRKLEGTITSVSARRCHVGARETATGTVAHQPNGYELWLLVEIGGFYPQSGPLVVKADGTWRTDEVLFGGQGTFAVYLAAAGPRGQRQIEKHFAEGARTGSYPAISRKKLASDVYLLSVVAPLRRP